MKNFNIYVDCTESVMYRSNSGIKRTVRKLIESTHIKHDEYVINVTPVVILQGNIYAYDKLKIARYTKLYYALTEVLIKLRKYLSGDADSSLVKSDKQKIIIANKPGAVENLIYFYYALCSKYDGVIRKIDIDEESILLYADSFWSGWITTTVEELNCKKYLVLYDVIPEIYPDFYSSEFSGKFKKSLDIMLSVIDGVITISKSELDNIRLIRKDVLEKRRLPVMYNYLGADFVPYKKDFGEIRESITRVMSQENVLLMVGTIEPRKNYDYAIDVFEILWGLGVDVRLVIIGNQGWMCCNTLKRIRNHSMHGVNLHHYENASDDELSYCYQHCMALVFSSIAEGFGLPLVEAMNHGKEVLASDIPIFREIGGDYPHFFPLGNSSDAAKAFSEFIHSTPRENGARSWISWDESVKGFYRSVVSMATNF